MSNFRIFGRIVDRGSGSGIPNLRVEVWDKDVKHDDLCGTAVTNAQGNYEIVFDESAFKDSPKDTLPDVYLQIFQGNKQVESTKDAVRKNVPSGDTEINFELGIAANSASKIMRSRPKPTILATGLEDYGKWKAMYKDHQRQENEPPFRRGRIWA
ncbi:cyanobactin biosynthesis PatC/TenC/TruC family protein [Pleurocapsa sp. PCC 7319]|uniref:cyanobactin biosynthesis PatC/TenC/TruC family protein n=1 Tax=Pleurocapsa sp. PCC 7319 TaxID=118161 RepID=UPI000348BF61|nr:cyanobactin biosynthesis PatC/TenC/TruC family protein [Pleurocapsa sp. PCC 7319]